jgi:hypothetical protein
MQPGTADPAPHDRVLFEFCIARLHSCHQATVPADISMRIVEVVERSVD